MYTLEKNNTMCTLCIACMLMPQILPFSTLMLVRTWYDLQPRVDQTLRLGFIMNSNIIDFQVVV